MSSSNNVLAYRPKKPASTDPSQLESYRGYTLIPLHKFDAVDNLGRKRGKSPRDNGWRRHSYQSFDARKHMELGRNVGARLGDENLVVDADPRNYDIGDDPLERLMADTGLNPSLCPRVDTGSGGAHIYFKKPADFEIVEVHSNYKGLEFKTSGRQVVVAGSIHPNGRMYCADPVLPDPADAPQAPKSLLALLKKPEGIQESRSKPHTPEQLAEMLDKLDPVEFQVHDEWLALMMACHDATGGEGVEEFIEWSTRDPKYSNHRSSINYRWHSLDSKAPHKITYKTLYKILHDKGQGSAIPAESTVEEDFGDYDEETRENRAGLNKLCDEWIGVSDALCFIRRSDLTKCDPEQFEFRYSHLWEKGTIVQAVRKNKLRIRKFESLTYLPEQGEFPDGEGGGGRYNIWRPSEIKAKPGDVSWFLQHVEYLLPDEKQREYFLDYLALLVQPNAGKICYALLLQSRQGTGKGAIGNLLRKIVGNANTVEPSNEEVMGDFTGWMQGVQLVIIHELMICGRLELMNRLKPLITEDKVRINEKYMRTYTIDNRANLLCFTNHADSLRLEDGDRRWLVLSSPAEPKGEDYYAELFGHINSEGDASAVKHYLASRNIKLSPKGRAPHTQAKAEMFEYSMEEADLYLMEHFNASTPPFHRDIVRFEDIRNRLVDAVASEGLACKKPFSAARKFLKEKIKAVQPPHDTREGADNTRYWVIRNHKHWLAVSAAERSHAYRGSTKL